MKISGKSASEIFESIRTLVQQQQLSPGETLPTVRDLAELLQVNRNTVAAAYRRLSQTGIARTQGRLGTVISSLLSVQELEGLSAGTPLIDLASGNPNPAWQPDLQAIARECEFRPRLYGEPTIEPKLKEFGDRWLQGDCPRGFEVVLTSGAVDAIERLATACLLPGDKVAVENPCFLGTMHALKVLGAQALGVQVDSYGMVPESLEQALAQGVQAVLLTPRAHNPTGVSLSKRRADALKQVLRKYPGVLIVIDDHYALLAETAYYSVVPAGAMRWALIRSVAKGIGPDLRLAFVACDTGTAALLQTRLAPGLTWVSHILQELVGQSLASPVFLQQLEQAKLEYRQRREALRAALLAHEIQVPQSADGINVWVPLQQDAKEVAYRLAKKGWLVRTGSAFAVNEPEQALRITISELEADLCQKFAVDLKSCLAN